jgi:hypothetical protein
VSRETLVARVSEVRSVDWTPSGPEVLDRHGIFIGMAHKPGCHYLNARSDRPAGTMIEVTGPLEAILPKCSRCFPTTKAPTQRRPMAQYAPEVDAAASTPRTIPSGARFLLGPAKGPK